MISELPPDKLRSGSDPSLISVSSTEHMKPIEAMIGQPRAHRALMFGIDLKELGFNIYAAGLPGIGKTTTVLGLLNGVARDFPILTETGLNWENTLGRSQNSGFTPATPD